MTSHSSVQCPPPLEFGALLFTAPSVWLSSCAAVEAPQQLRSTRANEGPELLRLASDLRVSPANSPIPQYTSASANTTYLRSRRSYPSVASSSAMRPKLLIPVELISTLATIGTQLASCTKRMCRLPPVSRALWS